MNHIAVNVVGNNYCSQLYSHVKEMWDKIIEKRKWFSSSLGNFKILSVGNLDHRFSDSNRILQDNLFGKTG